MLLGRRREQAAIDRMLERTRAGEGGGLVLRGEPGIGKSVLLSYAAERADGMRVLRAVGVEAESMLAFATLYRLLRPVLDRAQELPEPQARALGVAFGLEAGEAPDRFLVSVATLTLLSEVAGERPVLCLVDDAHWADTPSAQALTFRRPPLGGRAARAACRHQRGGGLGHRHGRDGRAAPGRARPRRGRGDPRRTLGALLAPADRGRLVRATGGNPLALLELPGALTGWPLAGRDPLHEPPRLAGELERAFLERARRRKPEVQTLLLLAAAEGSGYVETIRRAAERLRLDPGLLESPDLADLVQIDGPTVEFRHPLVRSAVYHGANPAARRKAHQALAEALDGEEAQADRRAWHRAQAAEGPDEEVACELERSAERTLQRSGHAAAAVALQRAAEFSRSDEDRARRLTAAAGAAWRGGNAAGARALLDRSERLGVREAAVRLDIQYLRGTIELHTGVPVDGLAILLQAAGGAVQVDPHRATRVLLAAAEAAFQADRADAVPEIGRLLGRLPPSGDPNDELLARLHLATKGTKVAEDPTTLLADLARVEELDDPDLLVRVGGMAWGLGDHALGRRLRTMAVTRARALGAAGTLAWALAYLAAGEMHRSRYASADATAALRGQEQEARRLAEETLAEATARRLGQPATVARSALVTLALANGRAEEALEQLETLRTSGPIPGHQGITLHTVPDLVEAAVRAGQPERAREQLDGYLAWAAASSPEARAVAARSRALLASGDEADHLFQEALRLHAGSDRPLDHARTELLYGEFLRRERRRAEARPHLRAALEAFERLGAGV